MKTCSRCKEKKPVSSFSKDRKAKNNILCHCKECASLIGRKWYSLNREKESERQRKKNKRDRIKNRKRQNKYQRERKKNDPEFKLKALLRKRVWNALRNNKTGKTRKTMDLLGCEIGEYKKHLESLFADGMTWENHGLHGWHIDHIKPIISFDLNDPEQQKKAFNYKNTQPLWAIDNLEKSGKII